MLYAQVMVAQRTNVQELTYAVPASIIPYITPGVMVEVPLRRQIVDGVVLSLSRRVDRQLLGKIKEIAAINKGKLGFTAHQIRVIEDLAEYYGASLAEVAYHALHFSQPLNDAQGTPLPRIKPTFIQGSFETRQKLYQQLIRKFQASKRLVFLFATGEALAAFRSRTTAEVVEINSTKASQRKLIELLAGNRSFLVAGQQQLAFLPLRPGDILVIDQPDHIGGKFQRRPYLRLKKVGLIRAKHEGIKLIFGSDLLSPNDQPKVAERIWQFQTQKLATKPLTIYSRIRSPFLLLPQIETEIEECLTRLGRVLVLAASKGWAPVLYCPACQEVLSCPTCGRPVALKNPNELICSYCATKMPRPTTCPLCRSNELIAVGEGVVQIQSALKKRFPAYSPEVISSTSTTTVTDQRLIVATEKILTFVEEKFDLVVLASMDRLLAATDPNGTWQLLDGLLQLSSRTEKMILQTHFPDHWVWSAFATNQLEKYYQAEVASRRRYMLAPFGEEFAIVGVGRSPAELFKQIKSITLQLTEVVKDAQIGLPKTERQNPNQVRLSLPIYLPRKLKTGEKTTLRDLLPPAWHLDIEP